MKESIKMKIRVTTTEEMLGSQPGDPEIHKTYIASKAPDAASLEDEIAAMGEEAVLDRQMTVFPRHGGEPVLYDYQIKGFFKDACGALRRAAGTESAKMKAYKKEIDGLIFVSPRHIPIRFDGGMGDCQRPLRASTPQGDRVALAHSESIPAGAVMEFDVLLLKRAPVEECRLRTVRGERRKSKKALRGYVRRDRVIAAATTIAGVLIALGILLWTGHTMAGWR